MDFPNGTNILISRISGDGNYISVVSGKTVVVLDTIAKKIRGQIEFDMGVPVLCMNENADTIGYGWRSFHLMKWDEGTRKYRVYPGPHAFPFYVASCAMAFDGKTYAVALYREDYHRNRLDMWEVTDSSENRLLWSHLFPEETDLNFQDRPSDLAITPNGQFTALTAWGDSKGYSPKLSVFFRDDSYPIFTRITPGSMETVSIQQFNQRITVLFAGKHVHANTAGNGGDIYCAQVYV